MQLPVWVEKIVQNLCFSFFYVRKSKIFSFNLYLAKILSLELRIYIYIYVGFGVVLGRILVYKYTCDL